MPRSLSFNLLLFLVFSIFNLSQSIHVGVEDLRDSYDYVVAGCGIAGLTLAARLTEDDSTVLCIEAGDMDHYEDMIQIPFDIGYGIASTYDWNLQSVPQTQLGGAVRPLNAGRGVGGGSLINGMIWNRGSQSDYDAWEALGNPGWGWNDLLPYFMKSENYTPEYFEGVPQQYQDSFDPAIHGYEGPVHVSYPRYYWQQAENFFQALGNLSIPTSSEPQSGLTAGGYFLPNNINPENQTRCDARRAYYDPYASRPNLHVLTNQHVTRVLFDDQGASNRMSSAFHYHWSNREKRQTAPTPTPTSSLRATTVEYAAGPGAPLQTVYANREVIISAGALHSPQILQLSGIGQSPLLKNFAIPVLIDLPGVGSNLQDHCMVPTTYPYENRSYLTVDDIASNASLYEEYRSQYLTTKTGPFTAKASSAVAFPSLSQIIGRDSANLLLASLLNPDSTLQYLPSTYNDNPSLITGYLAQVTQLALTLPLATTPAYELLQNNQGGLTPSLMHPLSRGTISLSTIDPFTPPLIDPRYLTHPIDTSTLLAALQFNTRLLSTPSLSLLLPNSTTIPDLTSHITSTLTTEFHYAGSCAMLPLSLGGVVDHNLLVHGTQNLRIVDSSVMPIVPGAHLMAPVFAIAEKAADLIKGAAV